MEVLRYLQMGEDPAALGVARYLYGAIMIIDTFEERSLGNAEKRYGTNDSCTFPLFDNMPLLPLTHIYILFLFMVICSFFVMIGFLFRISITCYAVMYWYLFFLNKTVWNNHSYLYGLLSVIFMLSSANNYWSVDGLIWPSIRNKKVPRWNYLVVKFQLFILYFFAGIKKLDSDWTSGYSMSGLGRKWIFDPFRLFMSNEMVDFVMVHLSGLFLDLTLGFQLICDKTRPIGYLLAYSFHGMNAIIFNIGMFSYMCMVMLPIFSRHDWPKRVISKLPKFMQHCLPLTDDAQENEGCCVDGDEKTKESWRPSIKSLVLIAMATFYVFAQVTLPFSHSITKGYNSWTNGLYGYSWDMMVHSWNRKLVTVKVVDKATGNHTYLPERAYTTARARLYSHPDMLKQYAKCIAEKMKNSTEHNMTEPQVFIDLWSSLNGRYQQRMINPRVDLVTAKWSPFETTSWLMPLLSELTPWRQKMKELMLDKTADKDVYEVIFVADFPGYDLENHVPKDLKGNITVLSGKLDIEVKGSNTTLQANDTLTLLPDTAHRIYTVSETPSCYMLVSFNTSLEENKTRKGKRDKEKMGEEKTYLERFLGFLTNKKLLYLRGLENVVDAVFEVCDYRGRRYLEKTELERRIKKHEGSKKLLDRELKYFRKAMGELTTNKEDFRREKEEFYSEKADFYKQKGIPFSRDDHNGKENTDRILHDDDFPNHQSDVELPTENQHSKNRDESVQNDQSQSAGFQLTDEFATENEELKLTDDSGNQRVEFQETENLQNSGFRNLQSIESIEEKQGIKTEL